jgi:hypothetical protein
VSDWDESLAEVVDDMASEPLNLTVARLLD